MWGSGLNFRDHSTFEHTGSQPTTQQLQHLPVNNPAFDLTHESVMVDVVKGVGDTLPTSGTFRKRCASCDPTIPSRARISSS